MIALVKTMIDKKIIDKHDIKLHYMTMKEKVANYSYMDDGMKKAHDFLDLDLPDFTKED